MARVIVLKTDRLIDRDNTDAVIYRSERNRTTRGKRSTSVPPQSGLRSVRRIESNENSSNYRTTRKEKASGETDLFARKTVPAVKSRLADCCVTSGDTIYLRCSVQGNPVPKITWLKDQQPLTVGYSVWPEYNGEIASLAIQPASHLDTGWYTCRAENPLGKCETWATVFVCEIPAYYKKWAFNKTLRYYQCAKPIRHPFGPKGRLRM